MIKLNLGCGQNRVDGFMNVDKHRTSATDVKWNLEIFPWPWDDNAVDEVLLYHSLEHMGQSTDTFIGIMKELYRVCSHGTVVHIAVPHPRHDHFLDDPTHVRVITPELLGCFSKRINLLAQKEKAPNSPLALYHDVDFEIGGFTLVLDEPYATEHREGRISNEEIGRLIRERNNVVAECRIELRVVKGAT